MLALQPEAGSGAGCKAAKGTGDSHLFRPGTYSLAGYHHAIVQLVACVAVFANARALGVPRSLGGPRAPLEGPGETLHIDIYSVSHQ